MIRIGPAGNCKRFYDEGFKKSEQAPSWLKSLGLTAFEYQCGHGVSLREATARAIGEAAAENGIQMSLHAPYYINCASEDEERKQKSIQYLLDSAKAIDLLGGSRVVFHIGTPGKLERSHAFHLSCALIMEIRKRMCDMGLSHIHLCPETMGRAGQIGTLREVLTLVLMDDSFIPTLDFGHLHTIGLGAINASDDFRAILDSVIDAIGFERAKHFHSHFSKISYNAHGERMHKAFADDGFGPDYALLAPLIAEYKLEPTLICESKDMQADDALTMRQMLIESNVMI